ncbi:WbqC family protein [Filimonas effusa]|uniref:WbqC family protein n=1 Tax=Filimonas effusa TaxID=2508721 RepID=A0A4Q1DBS9_9BACT|nr:WbqC family protein [Filimonas effusa]RXK86245.1 hypothetical protein ESB13_05405 [Filimonas effusa]
MESEKVLITDNQYFPCISLIKMWFEYSYVEIEACDTYQKNSFRNRCIIAGSNGLINLSVPLEKGRDQKASYRDIKIAWQDKWNVQHWRSITSCYRRAPYFDFYAGSVESLLQKRHVYLFDLNLEIAAWIQKLFKTTASVKLTDNFVQEYNPAVMADFRNYWRPSNFRNHTGNLPRYFQLFEDRNGFQPNLSIIDLLFCAGPKALIP